MQFNTIGQDQVSQIALGTWVFSADCWGGAERTQCISAVATALKSGINLIDTAPIYGHGRSEEIIGEAIKGRRDKVFIATKCGLRFRDNWIHHDLSPEFILEEIDLSLTRLQTDMIDLYQCHWPDPKTPIEKTMDVLRKLQDQQKIRYIGVSNFKVDELRKAMKEADIVTNQVPYSLLERDVERELIPFSLDNNVGILAYGPLGGGILTGKYESAPELPKGDVRSFFYKYYSGKKFNQVSQSLKMMADQIGKPLSEIAINWIRQQPGVVSVLVGGRNRDQVERNAIAASWNLTEEQMQFINTLSW